MAKFATTPKMKSGCRANRFASHQGELSKGRDGVGARRRGDGDAHDTASIAVSSARLADEQQVGVLESGLDQLGVRQAGRRRCATGRCRCARRAGRRGAAPSASQTRPAASAIRSATGAVEQDPAPVQHDHAFAERSDVVGLVGRDHDGGRLPRPAQHVAQPSPLGGVETGGGLVEDQQVRAPEHRLGEHDPAPLAARERADAAWRPRRSGPTRSMTRRTSACRAARSDHSLRIAM